MSLLDNIDDELKRQAPVPGSQPAAGGDGAAGLDLDLDADERPQGASAPAAAIDVDGDADGHRVELVSPVERDAAFEPAVPGSIFSPAPASPVDFTETRMEDLAPAVGAAGAGAVGLRALGGPAAGIAQRIFVAMVVIGLLLLVITAAQSLLTVTRGAAQVAATGDALMHSQRLAKSVTQSLQGTPASFAAVRESSQVLVRTVRELRTGGPELAAVGTGYAELMDTLGPLADRTETNTATIIAQQPALVRAATAVRAINDRSGDLLTAAEAVASSRFESQTPAGAGELGAVGQLVMLTQRIAKSASEFQSVDGVSPEATFLLGRDIAAFRDVANGLLSGNADLRLAAVRDAPARERLAELLREFEPTRADAGAILDNARGLASAREASGAILADSEPLREGLSMLQARLQADATVGPLAITLMLVGLASLVIGAAALVRLYVQDQERRAAMAEAQRQEAELEQQEAKRVNDANQAAILRLMNELQTVAEGDLTQQATVTEDITGAIADSVNYTVEELRTLVTQVQGAVGRVAQSTHQVELTSTELLAASSEQLREIRDTGASVLQMADRINAVSTQAQETASVARQSRAAAESGLRAVQDSIDGMNTIRDQIQDTAKRIKRLGESSQEIGEITELISDITEQTNVLALNAAIQAASAGEAGRGFSVVAEEVQRLAERSADATRQIAVLVKTIQTDTQDAVAAMERSTQGVVTGARLSDNAGAALGDIDRVSRRLDELIARISEEATREAESANVVAENIKHIFAVTEQAGEGTRSTAAIVRELAKTADELKQSVERFRVA